MDVKKQDIHQDIINDISLSVSVHRTAELVSLCILGINAKHDMTQLISN